MNNETIILDKIEALATELAFLSVGSQSEEDLKSCIVLTYALIKQGKNAEILQKLKEIASY